MKDNSKHDIDRKYCVCVSVYFEGRGCVCVMHRDFVLHGVSVKRSPGCPLSSAVCQIIIPVSLKLTFKSEPFRPTDTLINGPFHNLK